VDLLKSLPRGHGLVSLSPMSTYRPAYESNRTNSASSLIGCGLQQSARLMSSRTPSTRTAGRTQNDIQKPARAPVGSATGPQDPRGPRCPTATTGRFDRTGKRTDDYRRHGTSNLLAAVNTATGMIPADCYPRGAPARTSTFPTQGGPPASQIPAKSFSVSVINAQPNPPPPASPRRRPDTVIGTY
jgi:hypothetical protein